MDIWTADKLWIFLIFVLPGFVSLKVWDLLVPGERRGIDDALIDVVAYSTLNFAALFWLISPLLDGTLAVIPDGLAIFLIFVAVPVAWPIFWKWLRTRSWIARFTVHPLARPWDYVFSKREPAWIIVHLKNGAAVGGRYGEHSFASSWPAAEQLYLEELWQIDDRGRFLAPVLQSKGAIILRDEILAVQFFTYIP